MWYEGSVTILTMSQSWVLLLAWRVPCLWEYAWLATEMVPDNTMPSHDHHRCFYLYRRDVRHCQSYHWCVREWCSGVTLCLLGNNISRRLVHSEIPAVDVLQSIRAISLVTTYILAFTPGCESMYTFDILLFFSISFRGLGGPCLLLEPYDWLLCHWNAVNCAEARVVDIKMLWERSVGSDLLICEDRCSRKCSHR